MPGLFSRFLFFVAPILVLLAPGTVLAQSGTDPEQRLLNTLKVFEDNIQETGLGMEAIPAIDYPKFVSVADASLVLERSDVVFVLETVHGVRIYPQPVLVWHEVVNDQVDDTRVTITYSPLTGSVVGFLGQVEHYETHFGTTGMLLNNNLLLYDRATKSYWPQLLGTAISGPLLGQDLQSFSLLWTTWKRAKKVFPEAMVLSTDTGFRRSYGRDPYGSYAREGTYYDNNLVVYPVLNQDDRLPPKERILGVKIGEDMVAIRKNETASQGVANLEAGFYPLAAIHDPDLDTLRVFDRNLGESTLSFHLLDGEIHDKETGSVWDKEGLATQGRLAGRRLRQVPAFDCFWFAWAAFYPGTGIYPWQDSLEDALSRPKEEEPESPILSPGSPPPAPGTDSDAAYPMGDVIKEAEELLQ